MDKIKRVQLEKEMEDPYYLKDPILLELYKKSLPPKEAYYYFPKGEEIIIHNHKKPIKSLRRVFYNVPYTEEEKKWLVEFKQLLNSHPEIKLPDYFDDYFLLCFIYSTTGKLNDSMKRIEEYLEFVKKTFPILITPKSRLIEILNKGFIYVYGRDNRFRPIIVCQCKVFQKYYKDYKTEELMLASSFLCQYIVNNMLIPGQFETWCMIINLSGVSIISLPEPLKKMIPELSNYFLCRLYKNYLIGLNFITRILYKIAVNFIDKVTASKINVLDKKKDPKLFKEIREDNIEEAFGGTAPNLPIENENGFFPPRMPSQKFIRDEENINDILITEEEYINKYKKGEIPEGCISPYLYDQLVVKEEEKIEKKISEEIQEKKSEEINKKKSIVSNRNELKKSNTLVDKRINNINEENLNMQNSLLKKKSEEMKMKQILYHGWQFDEELSFVKNEYNANTFKHINILNDMNKFGKKRQNFFSNLSTIK